MLHSKRQASIWYGILGQVSGDVRKRRKADIFDDVFVTTRSSRCIGLSVTQEEIDNGDIIFRRRKMKQGSSTTTKASTKQGSNNKKNMSRPVYLRDAPSGLVQLEELAVFYSSPPPRAQPQASANDRVVDHSPPKRMTNKGRQEKEAHTSVKKVKTDDSEDGDSSMAEA